MARLCNTDIRGLKQHLEIPNDTTAAIRAAWLPQLSKNS